MATVILVIHMMIALALVGVVLVQKSEGGALGIGGGGGGGLLTGRGQANPALSRHRAAGCRILPDEPGTHHSRPAFGRAQVDLRQARRFWRADDRSGWKAGPDADGSRWYSRQAAGHAASRGTSGERTSHAGTCADASGSHCAGGANWSRRSANSLRSKTNISVEEANLPLRITSFLCILQAHATVHLHNRRRGFFAWKRPCFSGARCVAASARL